MILTSSQDKENLLSPTKKCAPRSLFKNDAEDKENKSKESIDNRSVCHDSLQPGAPVGVSRSPLEDKDASRENLSATSGSLSSLSPPSSPSKVKTENEKQEQEGNEKSDILGEFFEELAIR